MAIFRARARAVDMLGRQQIAGIPTAVSELFKNAHDAYADRVVVDYFRNDGLFVLRDDGIGMSRADFEERWLTLGTESKLGQTSALDVPRDPSKSPRPVLGEKGIGRLAIAAIGPQVLVLTRPKHARSRELTAAYINWWAFAIPGVNLDQIELSLETVDADRLLDSADVKRMVEFARRSLRKVLPRSSQAAAAVFESMDKFDVNPREVYSAVGEPSLSAGGHGTHFFILPTDESLSVAIDAPDDEYNAPPMYKTLVGFTNTMTPGHEPPRIETAFRDHKPDGTVDNRIKDQNFFTPDEFRDADHHIEGTFDRFGQFRGTVTVYGEPTSDHVVPWTSAGGDEIECGAFRLSLAIVQGTNAESTLPAEDWVRITRKLNRIGGLYIYKDGIRVLPYGNNDYDFLDIERRRTKSASYYYFSYRRMFGVIELSSRDNTALSEKAGREGFRENKAYRQFRDILVNFFTQIAADFFREGGIGGSRYEEKRSELSRLEKARRKAEKRKAARRTAIAGEIGRFFERVEAGEPVHQAATVVADLANDIAAAHFATSTSEAARVIAAADERARKRLEEIASGYRISLPRGVGLAKRLKGDYEAQQTEYERLVREVIAPRAEEIEAIVSESSKSVGSQIDRRLRFDAAINDVVAGATRSLQHAGIAVRSAAADAQSRVVEAARASTARLESTVREVVVAVQSANLDALEPKEAVDLRMKLEQQVQVALDAELQLMGALIDQANQLGVSSENGEYYVEALDATEALEEEVLALRERAEADIELAQLGMALQVITHEFDASIQGVRRALRELRVWVEDNPNLRGVYTNLRVSFDHLDGYLALFTPLERRLYQKRVKISGAQIIKFLSDLFRERLQRHNVELKATRAFLRHSVLGYPSTFYPVFVNLVDNSAFWLCDSRSERRIELDAANGVMYVSDTGPGVVTRDTSSIFELGFTRKPGGRGMGLFIAKTVLAKEGYDLRLTTPRLGSGTTFEIIKVTDV
jgi:signal transduction histidine kinase